MIKCPVNEKATIGFNGLLNWAQNIASFTIKVDNVFHILECLGLNTSQDEVVCFSLCFAPPLPNIKRLMNYVHVV